MQITYLYIINMQIETAIGLQIALYDQSDSLFDITD